MATGKEMRAKLVIDAQTSGKSGVEEMAAGLEQLAAKGGEAAPKLQLLAAELRGLAQQQGLVDQFARLKTQLAAYAEAAAQAQARTREAALALKDKQQALAQAQAHEQALVQSLEQARQRQEDVAQSIAAARAELKALGEASKKSGQDAVLHAEQLHDVRGQLKVLQAEYKEAGAQVRVLAGQQREAGAAMRNVSAEAQAAAKAFDSQRAAAKSTAQAYEQGRVQLQRTRDAMAEVGISSSNLAMAQKSIRAEIERVRERLEQAGGAYTGMATRAQAAAASADGSHRKISKGVQSISQELALLRNAYFGLQTALGTIHAAKGLADTADAMANLRARIKLATGEGELFTQVWSEVANIAQRTSSGLETTGMLFARVAEVGKDAGLSAQLAAKQSLAIVETINQAIELSGGGAESAQAAVTQLIQGLQSGVLRGEEFNSVMEQAPRLARALSQALGVTLSQLRGMAEQGELTSEVVINALKSQAATLRQEFASLPPTIGRAIQNLSTAWSLFIDKTDEAGGVSRHTAAAIDLLAANLGTLMDLAGKAGLLMVGLFAARTVQAAIEYSRAVAAAAVATDALGQANGRASIAVSATTAALQRFAGIARTVGYAAIANEVLNIAGNYMRYRDELKKHAQIDADIAQKEAAKLKRLAEISRTTGVVVTSMEELNAAQRSGTLVFDEASAKWLSAAQAQEQLARAAGKTAKELASLKAVEVVKQLDDLTKAGKDVQEAFKEIAKSLDFNKPEDINALIQALGALSAAGRLSAQETTQAWQAVIASMDPQQLTSLLARAQLAYGQAAIGAEQLAKINELVLAASFERLGVNAAQALGKVSEGAQQAVDSVQLVASSARAAGVGVQEAARAIEMAFAAAVPKADSLEAIDALQQKLVAMGSAGQIGAQGMERIQAALDKQRATIEQQLPGIQSLQEALTQLGVKPQKELEALARSAREAFDAVKASGTATPREINEAWKAMAEAAIAANNGVADASVAAQARQYGMVIETDKAGKSIVKSMKEAEEATKNVGAAAKGTAQSMQELANAAWDSSKDLVTQAREHNAALSKMEAGWWSAEAAASQYAAQMSAVVWAATKSVAAMTEEHARLVQMMEALAEQQRQVEAQGNGAAKGVDDLRMRLLELSGTEAEIARARHEREEQEVQRKIQLMQLDMQRAQIKGDQTEQARLQEELRLLQEQLKLLDKIYETEERQRRTRERGGAGGGPGSGGSGSGAAGGVAAPAPAAPGVINITLNANGINDPERLARMIEPELERIARLKR